MRILLGRHAQSDGNMNEEMYLIEGDEKLSITQTGCLQALGTGAFLENYYKATDTITWPEIFISPAQRVQETFRGMYEGGLKNYFSRCAAPLLKEDVRLLEKFFGGTNALKYPPKGVPSELVEALLKLSNAVYQGDPFTYKHLHGESSMETAVRVKSFIDGTLARDIAEGKDDFLIVTHGAVIQAFIMNWFHLPMRSKAQLGNPNNGDIIEITGEPKKWSVKRIYDGEAMKPDNNDLIANIDQLKIETLPKLPYPKV